MSFHRLACIFLLLLFWSCSSETSHSTYVIGFSQCTSGDWRRQMLLEMKGELAFQPDFELEYKDAGANNEQQIKDIKYFIDKRVDLLIVSPNESEPLTSVVEDAFKSGIPVVIVDRKINSDFYTAYIGANNYAIGAEAGNYVSKVLNGKGTIVEIWGLRGSTPAIERHNGFMSIIKKYPAISIVKQIEGKWEYDITKIQVAQQLDAVAQADLIFSHNDLMAFAAHDAIIKKNPSAKTIFIGIDGLPGVQGGIDLVQDSILTATFLYPTGGSESIQIASKILHGKKFEKNNVLPSLVIDKNNSRVMKLQGDQLVNQQRSIIRQKEKIDEQIGTFKSQRILIFVLIASLSLTLVFGLLVFLEVRNKNRINKLLQKSISELDKAKVNMDMLTGNLQKQNDQLLIIQEELTQLNQHLEERVSQRTIKLEESNKELEDFSYSVSHDLRTPLRAISGYATMLEEDYENDKESEGIKLLSHIQSNAIKMGALVDDLLAFSRLGRKEIVKTYFEANDLVNEIIREMGKVLTHHAEITVSRLHPIYGDSALIKQVFVNLISNAIKYSSKKKTPVIGIKSESDKGMSIYSVTDNGVGFDMTYSHKLFNVFQRLHSVKEFEGTGAGLAIVKRIVVKHGGMVWAEGKVGDGATFYFSLPKQEK